MWGLRVSRWSVRCPGVLRDGAAVWPWGGPQGRAQVRNRHRQAGLLCVRPGRGAGLGLEVPPRLLRGLWVGGAPCGAARCAGGAAGRLGRVPHCASLLCLSVGAPEPRFLRAGGVSRCASAAAVLRSSALLPCFALLSHSQSFVLSEIALIKRSGAGN